MTNGLLYASNWLQLAFFDPLMYYPDAEQQEDGVENAMARFYELIGAPPESIPVLPGVSYLHRVTTGNGSTATTTPVPT